VREIFTPTGELGVGLWLSAQTARELLTETDGVARFRDWLAEHLPDETTIWNWVAREGAIDRYARRELGLRFRIMICRPIYAAQRAGPSEITPQDQSLYGADMNLTARRSSILSRTGERIQNRLQWVRRRIIGF
jgi:hypothetical protein